MLKSTCSLHRECTHTHPFNGPLSGTTRISQYQKGKTNLDFTEARDSELQWNPLVHMQVCTSLQTDNHAITPPLRECKLMMIFAGVCGAEREDYSLRQTSCSVESTVR